MIEPKVDKLILSAELADRADKFAKSKFWLDDLGPLLLEMRDEAIRLARWEPGRPTTDSSSERAYYSGRTRAFEDLYKRINLMITDGQKALAKLHELEEAKKAEAPK